MLVNSDVVGIKTGITNMAGGCLATCLRGNGSKDEIFVVVLGAVSAEARFTDTLRIIGLIAD